MLQGQLVRDDLEQRDPAYVAVMFPALGRVMKLWFRSQVHGMERVPAEGGALLVSHHSGGLLALDVPILAAAFVDRFGPARPLYVLGRDALLNSPAGAYFRRSGFLAATAANTEAVLGAGAVTIVFPGSDDGVARPAAEDRADVVDFGGRTDYVRTALAHGVPIVPVVSTGGQDARLRLPGGALLSRAARTAGVARLGRLPRVPLPLPTKITVQVLEPVDVVAEFGPEPDAAAVDEAVRDRMQAALDELARQRRFPVLG